jgi:hypothetical protein
LVNKTPIHILANNTSKISVDINKNDDIKPKNKDELKKDETNLVKKISEYDNRPLYLNQFEEFHL